MKFDHPQLLWLLLVLPPALLAFLWWASRKRDRLLAQFIQARLLPELTIGLSRGFEQLRIVLLVAAVTALVVALARPQWGFTWEEARQKGLDVIVAIDTSKSMLAEDIAPNRLARAKLAAIDLMQTAKSDRLGLVAFAGGAFLQCPMTIDDAAFRQSVDILDANTLPQGGTAIAEAITTAQAAFEKSDGYKVLVLFTDGEDHDSNAVDAARRAAEAGMRIFTIGIGSAEGELLRVRDAKGRVDYVRDEEGNVVKSRLNETMLQEIATAGQGFYLPMRGAKVIETLYKNGLEPLPKSESDAKLYKHYHERYYWPLGLAMLLLVIEILLPARRAVRQSDRTPLTAGGKLRTAALAGILLLPLLAHGSPGSALRSYQAGQYEQARQEYERLLQKWGDDARLALNAGTAAYREGNLQKAEELLSQATSAPDLRVQQQAYYNRGNTRFEAGDTQQEPQAKQQAWEQSLKDFESAMKLNEADTDAKHNYEYVKQRLEELKQQQQQNQDKKDDKQKDEQKQDQQQDQQSQKQDQQDQQQSKSQDQQDQAKQDQQQQQQDQQKQPDQSEQDQQAQQKNTGKPDEQKGQDQQSQAASATEQQQQMTPDQALRVLDSTKGDEKVLPVQPLQPPPTSTQKVKDW